MDTHRPTGPQRPLTGTLSRRLGVVVPAKNEAATLPDCLAALGQAALQVDVDVHIVVVLDACTDSSWEAVEAFRAQFPPELAERVRIDSLAVQVSNVGAARAAGVRFLLDRLLVAGLWVASTDADSRVPTHWLAAHFAYARAGADAVAGTVTVTDWGDRSVTVIARARAEYQDRPALSNAAQPHGHAHVHAANLGVSGRAYVAVGGFLPLLVHEDAALMQALLTTGMAIADGPVDQPGKASQGVFVDDRHQLDRPPSAWDRVRGSCIPREPPLPIRDVCTVSNRRFFAPAPNEGISRQRRSTHEPQHRAGTGVGPCDADRRPSS